MKMIPAMALAMALVLGAGCLTSKDDGSSSECGPRPEPVGTYSKVVIVDGVSYTQSTTVSWRSHEAWVSDMVTWADCMAAPR